METGAGSFGAGDAISLLGWKHAIFDLYASVRLASDPEEAWRHWRAVRDTMYREHPQSPIPAESRSSFTGCPFHDYDPVWRTVATVIDALPEPQRLPASTGAPFSFTRIGIARFELQNTPYELELAWNNGYGGGLFLSFTDATSGTSSYGGGRYLIDTVKGADLGFEAKTSTITLDFNFAFNPSCSYDPGWACPLAPPANRLALAVTAGEMYPPAAR